MGAHMLHPQIIQGGMGVAVSGWPLARAVSQAGQLGVVSGTALAVMLARRLQTGDRDGRMRYALSHFPFPALANRILSAHFVEGGKPDAAPFRLTPMPGMKSATALVELHVAGSFAEVFLARAGHAGVVGINLLEKIQLPTLPSLYGAMLAGVDYVLMGAGIPRWIPGALDLLAEGKPAGLRLDVQGAGAGEVFVNEFDPAEVCGGPVPALKRPLFLGIVSSATLAITLARKSNGRVDGFVVEGETAGGHNAPPRGPLQLSPSGEPVYGPRDVPEIEKIRALGLPFWMAGSYGRPGRLRDALQLGATGIQVGTAFAFCEESGLSPDLKKKVLAGSGAGTVRVFTDPVASPTGFPFKVLQMAETLSEADVYAERERICDVGYLRHLYRKPDGSVGYRCPAEPVEDYLRKGGKLEDTIGRKCVCNGLLSSAGVGQVRPDTSDELPLVTAGDDAGLVASFLQPGATSYRAAEVIAALLAEAGSGGDDLPESVERATRVMATTAGCSSRRSALMA